ncbi:beta strand repeat-containing protein [Spirosoma utsteinense]|uniref:Uncharacterized protein n=1 Tax=Spirosoma utsteinense TaxID=2585773 RepID=A0ABR6WD96_9BACT|nr:hypothetical protein [Spirosoma utsteinense]MBC3794499.1 hypothetical protein [Spirosoma utsteinense]
MTSATSYTGNDGRIGSAQITVSVPTTAFATLTQSAGLPAVTGYNGMVWAVTTRVNAPAENPGRDYLSFGFSQSASPTVFDIQAGVEILLFSFNATACPGTVNLWTATDLFQGASTGTGPGNQITILGNGPGSAYDRVYGTAATCTPGAPDLTTTMGPVPGLTANSQTSLPVRISNVGTLPANGPLVFTTTLPQNIIAPASFTAANGWGCSTTNQVVTCTNAGSLGAGTITTFSVPITPSTAAVGTTPVFTGTVSPVSGETATSNNSAPAVSPNVPVQATLNGASCNVTDCGTGVRYGIRLNADNVTYTVYMKSETAYSGITARIATAQVTLQVPTGTVLTNQLSIQPSTNWALNTRVNQPSENTSADYLSFGYSQSSAEAAFAIQANVEIPLFSFRLNGNCTGPIQLWSATDPFQGVSRNTNPGNQMTILGNGTSNAWQCNYTCPVVCSVPDLTISLGQPSPNLVVSQTSQLPVTISNVGSLSSAAPLRVQFSLPAGLTLGSGLPAGWVLQSSVVNANGSRTVTLANATASVAPGASVSVNLPVVAAGSLANTTPTLTAFVTPASGESNTANNGASMTTNVAVQPLPVDLTVTLNMPSEPVAGVPGRLAVVVENVGSGPAEGPLSLSVSMPAGVSLATGNFNGGNGWGCSVSGQTVSCTNVSGLLPGSSLTASIGFTPTEAVTGSSLLITAFISPVAGEINTTNNTDTLTSSIVRSVDLALSLGSVPTLIPNQSGPVPVSISNPGQVNVSEALSITFITPSGVTLNTGSLPSGVSLISVQAGSGSTGIYTLSVANSSGLSSGSTLSFNLPVVAGSGVSGLVSFSGVLGSQPGESMLANNRASVTALVGGPDLVISAGQPGPALVVGQVSQLPVVIGNLGNLPSTAPLIFQLNLPVGMSVGGSLPTGWQISSSVPTGSGTLVTFRNSSALVSGTSSLTVNIPVVAAGSLANSVVTVGLAVSATSGETNTANNTGSMTTNLPVTPAPVPDLSVQIPAQSIVLGVNQVSAIRFDIMNVGTLTASAPLSLTFSMPVGFQAGQSTFTTGGWSCTGVSNQIGCTSSTNLPVSGVSSLTVAVRPTAQNAGQLNPVFQVTVAPAAGETVLNNNTDTINYAGNVIAPDLAVSVPVQSFTLISGQTSNLTFSALNASSGATALGPLSLTFTMPSGFSTAVSGFTTSGWTCSTTGREVVCTTPANFSANAQTTLTVPVLPLPGAVGLINPGFQIVISPAAGELVFSNNTATINYVGTVQNGVVSLALKALLQGPFNPVTGLMNDHLREQGLIPGVQPYSILQATPGYVFFGNGATEALNPAVLTATGVNAIEDWVMVELRDPVNRSLILATKPALIQRDGDVVSPADGVSPLTFNLSPGQFHVVIRHRNHLGAMSNTPVSLTTGSTIFDFTNMNNVYKLPGAGNYPEFVDNNGLAMLWAGNTQGDNYVIFQGPNNDVDEIFFDVSTDSGNTGELANYIKTGYLSTDVNHDGRVIFQGPTNEVDSIFFNVSMHPENIGQLANFLIRQHLP